jgi:uncharacterized membrane protein YgcG
MSAIRVTLVLALWLAPVAAWAGNGTHPRTPVKWDPEPPCMTIVDRSESAGLEFAYTIPYEDVGKTVDEVEDSRTHQFLAFCRQHAVQLPLPSWLSAADVADADEKGLVNPDDLGPADIIDTSPEWMDCMVRITADDQRRPITFAEAMKPVVWDTTGVPVGAYVINGYTYEPTFNIYSLRNGVVKVVDDPDPAMSPPALAIRNRLDDDVIVYKDEQLRLFGCLSALDGSTVTGYWARTDGEEQTLDWQMFAEDVPVEGDEFELMYAPTEASYGLTVFRVDITDPMDRTYSAHTDVLVSLLSVPRPEETSGGCDGSFIADPGCASSGESSGYVATFGEDGEAAADTTAASAGSDGPTGGSSGTGGGSSGSGGGPDQTPPGGEGCAGCAVGGPAGSLVWLLGLGWARRRGRRTR